MVTDLPETWAELRAQHATGIKLHSAIGKALVDKCFSMEISNVVNIFYQSIPIIDAELKRVAPEHRRLKLVMDIARSVGYYDIFISKREEERRLLFEAALIVLLYCNEELFQVPYLDLASLLEVYPEFTSVDTGELIKLLCFTNFMSCALILLPAKGKKSHLLDLVTRIAEGHKQKYVTGGGQTGSTSLRVLIYEREGGVTKMQRPPRRTEWSSILEILKDDTNSPQDVPEQIIQSVGWRSSVSGLVSSDISTQSSTSYEHITQPNVFVEETEVTLTNGGHQVRAMSVTHRVSDCDSGALTSQELLRTVTLSCAVNEDHQMDVEHNSFDDFFNEEDLRFLECNTSNSAGLSFNRSTSSDRGKVYRNVSISKMAPAAISGDFSYITQNTIDSAYRLNERKRSPGESEMYQGSGGSGTGTSTGTGSNRSLSALGSGAPTEALDFENLPMSSWPSRDLQQLTDLMQCRSLESISRSNSVTYGLQPAHMSGTFAGDIPIGYGMFSCTTSRRASFSFGDYSKIREILLPVVTDCDDDDDNYMKH